MGIPSSDSVSSTKEDITKGVKIKNLVKLSLQDTEMSIKSCETVPLGYRNEYKMSLVIVKNIIGMQNVFIKKICDISTTNIMRNSKQIYLFKCSLFNKKLCFRSLGLFLIKNMRYFHKQKGVGLYHCIEKPYILFLVQY